MRFSYPALMRYAGGQEIELTFPDLPDTPIAQGEELEAYRQATEILTEALATRLKIGAPLPAPAPESGDTSVPVPGWLAAKLALYFAMQRTGVRSAAELGGALGMNAKSAARLLDPDKRARLEDIERALAALGLRLTLELTTRGEGSGIAAH
ncbi:antitoxin HicB [Natronocella acetinitrilica]|uniref:Antitoxin HicB n=1 Tax=Natronocella acetinitrilica TaxID=414046 RepID=A0AAE3G4V7_9GAMM|nr:hypothetical protein [Natronocella acetinitrilica]MCP1674443.1 antitoxin HicB [Natronocella acetinitrilica]